MKTIRNNSQVIVIGNQKGGVGKTTTCVHLAAALGELGHRVLVMDLDPAAGSTKHLGVDPMAFAGALELLRGTDSIQELAITSNMPKGVHLIASRTDLVDVDVKLSRFIDRTQLLEQPMLQARQAYDFILLDTPPSAAASTTVAAYCAADWFLVACMPHPLAIAGLKEALKDWRDVQANRNQRLELLGILLTCVDLRSKLGSDTKEFLGGELADKVFDTWITSSSKLPMISGVGKTLFDHEETRTHKVTDQFRKFAKELIARINQQTQSSTPIAVGGA